MWPDNETPEPAAWINFNAATSERNVSFVCESELASIPLWPEPIAESTLLALARRCLWIAYVWNDHNFEAAQKCAKEEAEKRGINSFEQSNDWLRSQPQRKPLTDDQIAEICMDCSLVTPSDIYFARAIEKAHGIGEWWPVFQPAELPDSEGGEV